MVRHLEIELLIISTEHFVKSRVFIERLVKEWLRANGHNDFVLLYFHVCFLKREGVCPTFLGDLTRKGHI